MMDFKRFAPDKSTIYVGGCGKISALDMQTGKEKWISQVSTDWTGQEVAGIVCLNGLVVMATRGKIYAVETSTGKAKWTLEVTPKLNNAVVSTLCEEFSLLFSFTLYLHSFWRQGRPITK